MYSGTNSTLAAATLAIDQTNNRVGIGTASPTNKLTLQSAPAVGTPQAIGTDGTVSQFISYQTSGGFAYSGTQSNHTYGLAANNSGKVFITSAGNVGIGTSAPSDQLHIEGATPIIRLKDTTSTTAEYVQISASNSTGSVLIAADPGNTTASTTADISVDGTTRISATTTGVALTGAVTATGLSVGSSGLTSSGGITVSNGALTLNAGTTISVPAGSVAGAAIADNGVTVAKLAQLATLTVLGNSTGATANAAALTSGSGGTARTALGLGTNAYSSASFLPAFQVGAGVGQVVASSTLASTSSSPDLTFGAAGQTWFVIVWKQWVNLGSSGAATIEVLTAAKTYSPISGQYGFIGLAIRTA